MLKLLLPYPAVLIKTARIKTLVIADLHIGWEMALRVKGIHLPSQTPKILQKLKTLISMYKPENLLILGDVKNTVIAAEPGEWHDIPAFFAELQPLVSNISIIRGNHDANLEALLPENIHLLPAKGTIVGNTGLFHGHSWPSPTLLECGTLVTAHLHPMVVFRDSAGFKITRQVWIKAKCDPKKLTKTLLKKLKIKLEGTSEETVIRKYNFKPSTFQVLIMPSFNSFLGGRPINERRRKKDQKQKMIGPIMRSEAVDFKNSEIYLLDGTYLGNLDQLQNI